MQVQASDALPTHQYFGQMEIQNDKPMAMQSRSMARIQCCTTVLKRTILLSALDVNSPGNNQP